MITRKKVGDDVFTAEALDEIHKATMRILQETGVEVLSEEAREHFRKAGVRVEEGHVHLTEEEVFKYTEMAPEKFELKARNPENNVVVGGKNTVLSPGYGSPFVMDYKKGERRNSKFADYERFTKLAQWSENIDVVGGVLVEPTDLDDRVRHGKMLHTAVTLSDKCLMGSAMGAKKARECLDMAAIVFESEQFVEENVVLISLINTNSPLQFDERMSDALTVYAENHQAVVIASLSMTGTTSPTTLPASLVQQNAEILTGICLTQIINPGAPVVYGSASSVVDLKTGDLALGSPETAKMFNGTAQIARKYGVPSRGGGALTDSLFPDAQAGYEAMLNIYSAINSGFNFMLHSAGLLENYMSMSYEKFIIDEEILGVVNNVFSGLEVDEELLAEEVINEVGSGGNFIASEHTYRHMKDMRIPTLSVRERYFSDRDQYNTADRAHEKCQQVLENFTPPELSAGIKQDLENYIDGLA